MRTPLRTARRKSVAVTILLVAAESAAGAAFPDATRRALDQVDLVLSAGLVGTLAGLSITSAALSLVFYNFLSERMRVAGGERRADDVKSLEIQRKSLVDAGKNMVNAFYSFVLAMILILFLENGFATQFPPDVLNSIVITSSTTAPFISGLVFLVEGARGLRDAFGQFEIG